MFNALRMDMYLVFKGRSFRIFAILTVATCILAGLAFWFTTTSFYSEMMRAALAGDLNVGVSVSMPGDTGLGIEDIQASLAAQNEAIKSMTWIGALGSTLVSGNGLMLLITLFVALLLTNEFSSGFIKNVLTSGIDRTSYFFSKLVAIVLAVVVLVVLGLVTTFLSYTVAGLQFIASPVSEVILWTLLIVLFASAYSMFVALIAWFTRSRVATVLVAVFFAAGLVASLLQGVLSLFPPIQFIADYTLYLNLVQIGSGLEVAGSEVVIRATAVAAVVCVLSSALGYLAIRKKDV